MVPEDPALAFRPARELRTAALAILRRERLRLAPLLPGGSELRLTGATSLPDALTGGDVDLHLRVPGTAFDSAVGTLRGIYRVVHPEIWLPTLATFALDAPLPTGIAATPIGSEHDVYFTRSWQLLGSSPELLGEYNDLKRRHAGGEPRRYRAAKAQFFARLVARFA